MSCSLLLPLLLAPLQAQEPASGLGAPAEARDVAALLEPLRERHGVPALAGAIVTTEGLTASGAVGLRSVQGEVAVSTSDLWHLGSCTKAMTATLVARLVERGLLTWETTVGEVFAELSESMDPLWREVPIRLLVSNRSGAPASLDAGGLWLRLRLHPGTPREQRRVLVDGVLRSPPEAPPGTRYVYSNAGFAIAGAMLETLADEPWETLMRRELFAPLRMQSTGFGVPGKRGELDQPRGHRWREAGPRPQEPGPLADNPPAIGPAGTVHSSLSDWARFAQAHLRGARGDDGFLEPQTWSLLQTPLEGQEYGFGWVMAEREWAGGRALAHSGSNTMWYCSIWLAPREGFGVLAATNAGGDVAARACDETCAALIRAYQDAAGAGSSR